MNALESRIGRAAVAWLAAFAAVAAVIGWETDWGRRMRHAPDVAPVAPPAPVKVALLPEYQLEGGNGPRRETVERPAFVPTRRPAPAAVQEVARPKMQRGQFALTGTAVVDKGSIAFLRETAGGRSRSVRAGDSVNGLTVAEVAPDRVKLVLGDESEELVLKVAQNPRTTVQPAQPGAPGAAPAGAPGAAPVPGQAPVPAGAQPPRGQPAPLAGLQPTTAPPGTESEATLLERRRAARAAQAAAEAAARAGATAAPANSAPQAAPPTTSGATPGTTDPAWADVYRRMQQPRR